MFNKIKVTSIAKLLNVSKGHTSEVITGLENEKIIKKGFVDLTNPYVKALKITININKIDAFLLLEIVKILKRKFFLLRNINFKCISFNNVL